MSGTTQYEKLLDYHMRMRTALLALRNAYNKVSADPNSGFQKCGTEAAYFTALEELRDELDQQVVLALIASVEAMVRRDFIARVQSTTKDPVCARFRILRSKYSDISDDELHKVQFESILDEWKDVAADAAKIGAIKPLYRRRHWLAHGRYWIDKSGTQANARIAQRFIDSFIVEIRSICPDFPQNI